VHSNNEHKWLIEQDFGMEILLLACGPRNQQINLALTKFLDLMCARIGQSYVQLHAGIFC